MHMQDEDLGGINRGDLIIGAPNPLWSVIRSGAPPRALIHLDPTDNVINAAARCGCLLVRTRRYVNELEGQGRAHRCPVCERQGGQNGQEKEMLDKVRALLDARAEQFFICCQLPLRREKRRVLRCDVVVVPRAAQAVDQLIGVELDGTNHEDRAMTYRGVSVDDSYNATRESDSEKGIAVRAKGMRFVRISWTCVRTSKHWHRQLSCQLDEIMQDIMRL